MKAFLLIVAVGTAAYLAIYGPIPLDRYTKQFKEAQAAKEREAIAKAKEKAWRTAYRQPPQCASTRTAIEKLQCKNDADNQRRYFDDQWEAAIAKGWKPDN